MKIYRREGRFKKKKERAKVELPLSLKIAKDEPAMASSTDCNNTRSSLLTIKQEKTMTESLLDNSFWADKLTEHLRSKEIDVMLPVLLDIKS